jgi:hypothetical protein
VSSRGGNLGVSDRGIQTIFAKLTEAHWYLDRAASVQPDDRPRDIAEARKILVEIDRVIPKLVLTADQHQSALSELAELRSRLNSIVE